VPPPLSGTPAESVEKGLCRVKAVCDFELALILQQGSTYQSVAGGFISMQAHDSSIHGPTAVHLWSSFEPKQADLCR
jgi:hypothetical protein